MSRKPKKENHLAGSDEAKHDPRDLVDFDHLITKDKLEKDDVLEDFLASVTETRVKVNLEWSSSTLPPERTDSRLRGEAYTCEVERGSE